MGILSLDNEFLKYWLKLSSTEKASLLTVAKQYVELREETGPISIKQYNREIDEAMNEMDKGEFLTHEQVVQLSQSWLDAK